MVICVLSIEEQHGREWRFASEFNKYGPGFEPDDFQPGLVAMGPAYSDEALMASIASGRCVDGVLFGNKFSDGEATSIIIDIDGRRVVTSADLSVPELEAAIIKWKHKESVFSIMGHDLSESADNQRGLRFYHLVKIMVASKYDSL
jgi:hypothetical protein